MRGEGRRSGGALIRLLARGEGWPTATHGVAAPARGARKRRGLARGRRRLGWASAGPKGCADR
jgi:hypothetical protein